MGIRYNIPEKEEDQMGGKKILEMREITKTFPGVRALDRVSFAVEEGEIHCLVGGERGRKIDPYEGSQRCASPWFV